MYAFENYLHEMGHIRDPTPIQFLFPTVSLPTQLCNVYTFINFLVDVKKPHVHWKQLKHNLVGYPSKYHSTQHHISVRPTYVLNNIQKETKHLFKLSKLPTTLQGYVQTHFPPIFKQPSVYNSSMIPVSIT